MTVAGACTPLDLIVFGQYSPNNWVQLVELNMVEVYVHTMSSMPWPPIPAGLMLMQEVGSGR